MKYSADKASTVPVPNIIKLSIHIHPPKSVRLIPKETEGIYSSLNSLLNMLAIFKHSNFKMLCNWINAAKIGARAITRHISTPEFVS